MDLANAEPKLVSCNANYTDFTTGATQSDEIPFANKQMCLIFSTYMVISYLQTVQQAAPFVWVQNLVSQLLRGDTRDCEGLMIVDRVYWAVFVTGLCDTVQCCAVVGADSES